MTTIKNFFMLLVLATGLFSCSDNGNNTPNQQATPEALQDDKLNFKSYGRSGNLIDELYQELVEKSPILQKLENELETFRSTPKDFIKKFQQYDSKSKSYYSTVNYKTSPIQDSVLRLKINTLISKSSEKYANKTVELNALMTQISKNKNTLNDHHTVLKIVMTLPILEKYQDDHKPSKKEFIHLTKKQENLILYTDSLTPKF